MQKLMMPLWSVLVMAVILVSCDSQVVYNESKDIPDGVWKVDSLASFDFEIADSDIRYDLSYNLRYDVQYPYYNVYVNYYIVDSTETVISSDLQNLLLFDKKTGTPLGTGAGDLFDREIAVFNKFRFDYPGKYSFKVKQFMRMEELPGITSFGLKVMKTEIKD